LPQGGARGGGEGLQLLQRAHADAARRKVHHAQEGAVVVRVGQQPQVRQRVLDFLALEEAQPAVHAVRQPGAEKRVFQHARLGVGAVEQRHVG
jgi:hypothetical protein